MSTHLGEVSTDWAGVSRAACSCGWEGKPHGADLDAHGDLQAHYGANQQAPVPMMTERQNRMLFALLRDEAHRPTAGRHDWASDVLGRRVDSFKTLTRAEARTLIDELAPPVEEIPYEEEAF